MHSLDGSPILNLKNNKKKQKWENEMTDVMIFVASECSNKNYSKGGLFVRTNAMVADVNETKKRDCHIPLVENL